MVSSPPIYIDATMLYRWRHLAPVGIVRLERVLASHLRFRSALGTAQYLLWDAGYRLADPPEVKVLDGLLSGSLARTPEARSDPSGKVGTPPTSEIRRRRVVPTLRRGGLKVIGSLPDHIRPFAEQAGWSMATLAVESARYVRRSRSERSRSRGKSADARRRVEHKVELTGCDLVALGLGWEYLDHEAMYLLKRDHGVRIHMPAFDLIPVLTPQLNAGQSDLVHRYYAEMAHFADSITSISESTANALRHFFTDEGLPSPHLAVNALPGFELADPAPPADTPRRRRHRFDGEPFILSVSTVEIRKNHVLLAKVWAECIADGIDLPQLVIVGRIGWDVDELLRWVAHAPELQDRVTIVSDAEDDELAHLYEDALFTVFPSRVEGWGLPITESLSYGKACLHSTDPAQLEASQGLMPALHPDDFLGWKREVVQLATDPGRREALERTIRERYVRRTPEEYCARYEQILSSRRLVG